MKTWAKRGQPRREGIGRPSPDDAHDHSGKEMGLSNLTMHDTHIGDDNEESEENTSHADKVRSQMDTKDLGAIMSRFFQAVSWRED